MSDENDLAVAGKLPHDVTSDAERVNEVAHAVTVRSMLAGTVMRASVRDRPKQITTGIERIDDATGGIRDGWCWLVGAETSWGKTMLAVHLAGENLDPKNPRADPSWEVLIVSFEDSEELYADRLMCWRTGISADNLRKGTSSSTELKMMSDAAAQAERKPLFIDARDRSAEWAVKEVARLLDARPNIRLVMYDYLQEARSEKRHPRRCDEVSYVAKTLRGPVKRRNRACVVLSQLNEERGPGGWPTRSSISESKDAGKGAEVIAFGFSPLDDKIGENGVQQLKKGGRYIFLDKVKQGVHGGVQELRWDDYAARFQRTGYGEQDRLERMACEVAPSWTEPSSSGIGDWDDLDDGGSRMLRG